MLAVLARTFLIPSMNRVWAPAVKKTPSAAMSAQSRSESAKSARTTAGTRKMAAKKSW